MHTERFAGLTVHIQPGLDDAPLNRELPLVVLLHGFGAPGTDLVPLYQELGLPGGVRVAFPEAPLELDFGFGQTGRAWWPIDMMRLQYTVATGRFNDLAESEPTGVLEAREQLLEALATLTERLQVPVGNLVLGGFSQGAMLSADVAFGSNLSLAGLVLLSSTLIRKPTWLSGMPRHKGLRVFQSHGTEDPILPFPLAEELSQHMQGAGLDVSFVPFSGGHGIPYPVLVKLSEFLKNRT